MKWQSSCYLRSFKRRRHIMLLQVYKHFAPNGAASASFPKRAEPSHILELMCFAPPVQ